MYTNYPTYLQNLLGSGYQVENDGVGGTTLLKRGDKPYWTNGLLSKALAFKPDIVTIKLGTNDTKSQNWDAHGSEFKADYLAMIDTLQKLSSKPAIFLVLPVPVFKDAYGIRDSILKKVIVVIKTIGTERNLPVIDANTPLLGFGKYFSDGVHPNTAGADSIAHVIYRGLMKTGKKVITIAPYGNSITQANDTHQSFRYPLWKKLIDAKIAFDFVGSMNTNFGGGTPSQPDYNGIPFDKDHEGHWGWRADEILNGMGAWLTKYTPDMVLMHVGSNDCIQGQSTNTTVDEITQIIGKLRNDNPSVVIFISNLIPCFATGAQAKVDDLNKRIEPLANQLTTALSPIVFVDQSTGISGSDLFDGIHPNAGGEEKMAQKWFNAISSYLTKTPVVQERGTALSDPVAAHAISQSHCLQMVYPTTTTSGRMLTADAPITNLSGKKMPAVPGAGKRAQGVYIITK